MEDYTISGSRGRPLTKPCPDCDKAFPTKGELRRHHDAVHKKIRHTCQHCPASYSQKFALMNHCKKVHPGLDYAPRIEDK